MNMSLFCVRIASAVLLSASALDATADDRFYNGGYVAPLGTAVFNVGSGDLDTRYGGTLGFGYRKTYYAFEARGFYVDEGASGAFVGGGTMGGSLFPFLIGDGSNPEAEGFDEGLLSNLYVHLGLGGAEIRDYANVPDSIPTKIIQAGIGELIPIRWGDYKFGIRLETLYQFSYRDKDPEDVSESRPDIDAPRRFGDVVVNLGLQLPFGASPKPVPTPMPAVAVVEPLSICADGTDNDGDGKVDFPADRGCQSKDDDNETDPPACSDGLDNDGDGLIDFPADKGCSAADDSDETDPCKPPVPGERISLRGCGTGDVIVLKGVNFEFDKSRLTPNAKVILDNVAEELSAYPDVQVEIGGHTDAKGTDVYNSRLSEQRAASVVKYLEDKGIAADRMTASGYGESQPVADNETDEGREVNRRVELKITSGTTKSLAPADTVPATEPAAADASTDGVVGEPTAAATTGY